MKKKMSLIDRDDCAALVIDHQVKLLPQIHDHEHLTHEIAKTVKGLRALDIPILVTQQYTKGMGETDPEVQAALGEFHPIEKTSFSCMANQDFRKALKALDRHTVIILGIEAHICVMQTALDLMRDGYRVVTVNDCIGSRASINKEVALRRLLHAGAVPSTSEMVLYELMRTSEDDAFKTILNLVK